MTDQADTEQRWWRIRQFNPTGDERRDEVRDLQQATANLRSMIRDQGYVIVAESVERGTCERVTLVDDGTSYVPWNGIGQPDGDLTEWSATAVERFRDDPPLTPVHIDGDGARWFEVPADVTAVGGGVRLQHDLDAEVVVVVHGADGARINPMFAMALDSKCLQVEAYPGTAQIVVERDKDADQ